MIGRESLQETRNNNQDQGAEGYLMELKGMSDSEVEKPQSGRDCAGRGAGAGAGGAQL